jgi:hypothetical protein
MNRRLVYAAFAEFGGVNAPAIPGAAAVSWS